MYPILFHIGNFPIYNYGIIMALAFVIAFGWVFYRAKKLGENIDDYYNVCLIALVGGIVGSRLMYVIVTWEEFVGSPWRILNLRTGGLVWYGGVILASLLILIYTKRKRLRFFHVADVMSAPMALGLGIGRLGCLMSGCCYGKPSDLPWAMMYPESPYIPSEIAGKRVHPSAIYEMIAAFAIAVMLVYLERHKKRDGQIFWSFFLLYGLARFILEFWRGDAVRGFIIPDVMSVSQGISVLTVIIAAIMLLRRPKHIEPVKRSRDFR